MAADVRNISITAVLQVEITGHVSRREVVEAMETELPGVEFISNPKQHVIVAEAHEAKGGAVVRA